MKYEGRLRELYLFNSEKAKQKIKLFSVDS